MSHRWVLAVMLVALIARSWLLFLSANAQPEGELLLSASVDESLNKRPPDSFKNSTAVFAEGIVTSQV